MGKRANAARAAKVAQWEAYQRDVVALGSDITGFRARAAAGGRKLTEEYEAAASDRFNEAMTRIRQGSAYQNIYDDYMKAFTPRRSNKGGTTFGDPTVKEMRDRRDPNFERWAAKEYGTIKGFKIDGQDPRRTTTTKREVDTKRRRAAASVGTGVNYGEVGPDYTGGLYG